MNREKSNRPTPRGGSAGHKETAQFDLFPNCWTRIGLSAQDRGKVFNNLLTHFNVETLKEAFHAQDGSKAIGIDGISKDDYGLRLEENLVDLASRIHKGTYRPQVKREILIPKADGKERPIAISVFEDKLVEWVLARVLTLIYEPIFIRNSFGFRPRKSAHDAIKATYQTLKQGKRPYVVDIDLAHYFNTVDHRLLMKFLSKRISDGRLKGLIGRFLKGKTLSQGQLVEMRVGTAQGSVMSPILANVYLHYVLDEWFLANHASKDSVIVRYADDAIFMFKDEARSRVFVEELKVRLQRYKLYLNEDKARVIDLRSGRGNVFHFLSFTFHWGMRRRGRRVLTLKTQRKSLHKGIREFYSWIKINRNRMKLKQLWNLTKAKLRGHYNYFGVHCNRPKLIHYYSEVIRSLFKWLNRRSQKRSFSWSEFSRKLKLDPLPKPPEMRFLKKLERNAYA